MNYDNIRQSVVAAIGALILTTTAVGAAVGPARIAETTPPASMQASGADQLRA